MADPESSLYVPHLMGITLDAQGVANTQVIVTNRRTGEKQNIRADGNKVLIADASAFVSGYLVNDVIEFNNVGASVGTATLTISDALGGFQDATMDCVAAPTLSASL